MIGILAIHGGIEEHEVVLDELGLCHRRIKNREDFEGLSGLILPGGESTVMKLFLKSFGMEEVFDDFVRSGKPVFGTCAGLILLSHLGHLNVEVERNAYGRQVASFVADLKVKGLEEPLKAHFIRAPKIVRLGEGVEILAEQDGIPVLVRQKNVWGASFHPELAAESALHAMIFSC